ncbi:class I SAM-dependent RNA methyltransferase [bacterium]|nr:class I SAM-dependent RNA methyltransferase [bacterium]
MKPIDDENVFLEKLRKKLGPSKKLDERAELERLFGKKDKTKEDRLRRKLVKPSLTVGDIIDINIDKLAYGGEGLGKHNNFPIFVRNVLPGDAVKIKLTHVSKDMCRAELVETLARSSNRIPPRCQLFGTCGGCQIQSLVYTAQIKAKEYMVSDIFRHIGGLDIRVRHVLRSPESFGYRIRTRLHVDQIQGKHCIGYYARQTNKLVPVDNCPLLAESLNIVLSQLTSVLPTPGTSPPPSEIVLQTSVEADQVVIHLIGKEPLLYVESVLEKCKKLGLPVSGVSSKSQSDFCKAGNTDLHQNLAGNQLITSSNAFIQANRFLMRKMIDNAIMLSSPAAEDNVLDLYCGSGFFSLPVARFVKSLIGLELNTSAIQNAITAAESMKLKNTRFIACDDSRFFKLPEINKQRFSLVIVDPPRSGLSAAVMKGLINLKPQKLLYVSCDPSTLARDIKSLVAADFKVRVVQPIDLFPHTYHIENMVFLTHRYTGVQAANQAFMDLR